MIGSRRFRNEITPLTKDGARGTLVIAVTRMISWTCMMSTANSSSPSRNVTSSSSSSVPSAAAFRPVPGRSSAAAALSPVVIPGLEQARADKAKNEEAIAAGKKILNPATVAAVTQTVPRIIEAKKAFEKNKNLYKLASTYLSMKLKSGGFKAQIDLIDSIQQNLNILAPLITLAQDSLSKPEIAALLEAKPNSPKPQDLLRDLQRLQPLMNISREAVRPEKVAQFRAMIGNLPDLGKSVGQLVDGTTQLSDNLQLLADGTKRFDEEGIQKISSVIVDKAKVVRGFLKVKDALAALSRDYRSFSGAPEGSKTSLKFIFKTDEIK